MIVLDATFLIDYLAGVEATRAFYQDHGGADSRWVVPAPALAEVLVGAGNLPDGDPRQVRRDLAWTEVRPVDGETASAAGDIAAEVGDDGPFLDANDALVAAVGRALDTPVASRDSDLTHSATRRVVDVLEY